MMPSSLAL